MLELNLWKQRARIFFSRFLLVSKKVREVKIEIELLRQHADQLSNDNIVLRNHLEAYKPMIQQFEEWKKNPGKVLQYYYPNLCIESLNFKLDKDGRMIKEEDNIYRELSKEDKIGHLRDIDFIHRSPAFNREMEKFTRDIQKTKVLNNLEEEGKILVLFLLFIAGMRARFKALSTELEIETKPKKEHIRTHPLGSMAK